MRVAWSVLLSFTLTFCTIANFLIASQSSAVAWVRFDGGANASATACPDVSATACPDVSATACPDVSAAACPEVSAAACPDASPTEQTDDTGRGCRMFEPAGGWEGVNKVRSTADLDTVVHRMGCYCMRNRDSCAHLRLERGALTVLQLYPAFQTRMKSSLFTLYNAVERNPAFATMPPVEFIVEVSDGQKGCEGLPVFMMTTRHSDCVMVPDFTFAGWPESSCPPGLLLLI